MTWLFAQLYDPFMRVTEEACLRDWRAHLLAPVAGNVLEIGAGTGANLPHYGPGVTSLTLVEPDAHMRAKLRARPLGREHDVQPGTLDARLPFADEQFDVVVVTFVLCSVTDPALAAGEIRRVLRAGGELRFIEHVAAEDRPERLRWQRRVEPVWRRLTGNCHLTRTTARTLERAGLELESLKHESMRRALPVVRPSIRGVARRPS